MKDQYDNEIPTDLVSISQLEFSELVEPQVRIIDQADWYEANFNDRKEILVSYDALLPAFDSYDLDYIKINDISSIEINKIDYILHRYNGLDSFYHA